MTKISYSKRQRDTLQPLHTLFLQELFKDLPTATDHIKNDNILQPAFYPGQKTASNRKQNRNHAAVLSFLSSHGRMCSSSQFSLRCHGGGS